MRKRTASRTPRSGARPASGRTCLCSCLFLAALVPAHAVIVRGKVTSPLGVPLPGARVQLIQGQRSIGDAISGPDGAYEIRTAAAGRFLLLTAPSVLVRGYAPQIGQPFYGSRTDQITIDVALNYAGITPRTSSQPTGLPTPAAELAAPPTQIAADVFLTQAGVVPELSPHPVAIVVEAGQAGAPAYLLLRGAPPQTILTTVDGVTANPLGGAVNLSTLAATGFSALSPAPAVEFTPTANPLHLTGAEGGLVGFAPAPASSLRPLLTYTGDAGTFGALRNEAVASWAHQRFELLGALSRFDIANATPAGPFHLISLTSDDAYHISAGTSIRGVARYDESVAALPSPFDFFGVNPDGKIADQNLFASATFETRSTNDWHNLLRYGMARERGQTYDFFTPATGLPAIIYGANGTSATGVAAFDPLPAREDAVTNRDEATYQTDYRVKQWLALFGEARFQDERAADRVPGQKDTLERTHLSAALGFQGDIHHRVFYETSGFVDHTQKLGWTGAPRLGLTYAPVRPGTRKFRGTALHLTLATGTREPSLLEQAANQAALQTPRSRTLDASVDQTVLAQKLSLRATYFHSQFAHEFEPVGLTELASHPLLSQTLALRTQGFESELRYEPFQRVLLDGGYSYLASYTEQSAEPTIVNPLYPSVRIGALSALAGQRPFNRPPQSGFFLAEYSGPKLNASIRGKLVSRSDGSTGLLQTPGLLLPNRNLSPSYAALDASVSLVVTRHVTAFTQMTNLTDNRHIAPIGYLSTPFLIRTGLRIRLGGE